MIYEEPIINQIRDHLIEAKQSISVGESVTSGHLQAALSVAPDASKFFQGGITAYNLGQKARHLSIDPIDAFEVDCVAMQVACNMALNAGKLFLSDYSIGITGYASIVPQCEKEGLHAFVAVSHKDKIILSKKIRPKGDNIAYEVQIDYANQTLSLFLECIKDSTDPGLSK